MLILPMYKVTMAVAISDDVL